MIIKKIIPLLLILVFLSSITAIAGADVEQTINHIQMKVPTSNNNSTSNLTNPAGVGYEDMEHDIAVYVCDKMDPNYAMVESFDSQHMCSQQYYVTNADNSTGKYVTIVVANPSDKDRIFDSLKYVE